MKLLVKNDKGEMIKAFESMKINLLYEKKADWKNI
jgi:hypothetical protein